MRFARGGAAASPVAAVIQQMMVENGPIIRRVPQELSSQAYAFMFAIENPSIQTFAENLRSRIMVARCPWLRLVRGNPSLNSSVLMEHRGGVRALTMLLDGRIASGGLVNVRLWDPMDGDAFILGKQGSPINALAAIGPNILASGSGDGLVRIWDLEKRIEARPPLMHGDKHVQVRCLTALGIDRIVSAGSDGWIRVWDRFTGDALIQFEQGDDVHSIVSLTVELLASSGTDGYIKFWSLNDNTKPFRELRHGSPWNPHHYYSGDYCEHCIVLVLVDDSILISGGSDGWVRLWNVDTGEMFDCFEHGRSVTALASIPGGLFALSDDIGTILVWDVQAHREILSFGHGGRVNALALTEDGLLVSAGADRKIRLWSLSAPVERRECQETQIKQIASVGDGFMAVATVEGRIEIWDVQNNFASSAESVGVFWLWKLAEVVQ